MTDSCREVLAKVEAYLDEELSPPEAGAVAEHLAVCPECLEHEVFLSRLRAILRAKFASSPGVPDALVDRIRAALAVT